MLRNPVKMMAAQIKGGNDSLRIIIPSSPFWVYLKLLLNTRILKTSGFCE
jgi:hypothetical protein